MLKSIFLFFLNSFRANTQLKLEVIFLSMQLEIYHDPKLKIKGVDLIRKLQQTDLSQRMCLN